MAADADFPDVSRLKLAAGAEGPELKFTSIGKGAMMLEVNQSKAGVKATVSEAIAPLFDYATESAAAKAGFEDLMKPMDSIKEVKFYDGAGKELEVTKGGYSSDGTTTTQDYNLKGTFPAKGRITVEVWETKNYEMAFKIEDISLLGTPGSEPGD